MKVDTLDAILAQNKIMSQQISMITQQLSRMQVLADNTQDASYDMNGGFNQEENYGYDQPTPEQETRALIRNLEVQVGQLSKRIPERPPNTLPGDTKVNPREECKALTMAHEFMPKEAQVAKELEEKEALEKDEVTLSHVSPRAPIQEPEVLHPQELQEQSNNEQFSQFLEVFKKLKVNIPFAKTLEKMPPYVAFMKGLLFEKKALKRDKIVVLTKECSALIQRKLPEKMPDPRNFQIPCTIGNIIFYKAICDLSSSINLMPLFVMEKLQIQEAQPTRIAL
ncbi:uncharacterized protein LOC107607221 [Arachis ipaensis]|uniref:uncharacterized protein LOC107607221 n=1 Tax=Arachis ipaensis TaxID=130454 RepID=UPI0007AF700E|nr:uncharacterized protein LOC107607221 [Arachis ipaensis]XP_025664889.1 uncharacterized protein LOC112763432 [Arachis hypogaea]